MEKDIINILIVDDEKYEGILMKSLIPQLGWGEWSRRKR